MKRNNTVSLSVHKNNLEQKRNKYNRQRIVDAAKYLKQSTSTEGFFFVSWDKGGGYHTQFHDPQAVIGKSSLPDFVGGCASRLIGDIDAEDR